MNTNDIAIKVESLSKCYRIGVKEKRRENLGSTIFDFIKSPLSNYSKYRSLYQFGDIKPGSDSDSNCSDIIWSLRDISFEIKQGEVVGIIGKNGAGKSTLLKVLSRITTPTRGRAEIHGKVSCLLEVGTGFHPELTGRENVYLNGTILGMRKKEIDLKFDEIVDFSGVEKFIDTPVKRYSSGMKVRLAFSVAAHLEPEILIIDEVLAVGDAEFQNKCLGKLENMAKKRRTVLFVSHNMGAINRLCDRTIWIDNGRIRLSGSTDVVIESYLSSQMTDCVGEVTISNTDANNKIQMRSVRVLSAKDEPVAIVEFQKSFRIEIAYELFVQLKGMAILSRVTDMRGNIICTSWDTDTTDWKDRTREPSQYLSICNFPGCLLRPGRYLLSIGALIDKKEGIAFHENILSFEVSHADYLLNDGRMGIITPLFDWEVIYNE